MKEKEIIIDNDEAIEMTDELENVIYFLKNTLSKELPTLAIDIEYFILGVMLEKNSTLYRLLDSCLMSNTMDEITNACYSYVSSKALTAVKPNREIGFSKEVKDLFSKGKEECSAMGKTVLGSEHVFLAMLKIEDNKLRNVFVRGGITYKMFKDKVKQNENTDNVSIDYIGSKPKIFKKRINGKDVQIIQANSLDEITNAMKDVLGNGVDSMEGSMIPGASKKKKGKTPYITEYCMNLNQQAIEGKITRIVGRERETEEIIRVLGRKKKNNVILVGGEGVGKTAIGESIALQIVEGNVPTFLEDKIIVSLDMTALMAGTTLRGMFEERVKGILDEVRADNRFILFMDNIGAMMADKSKNDFEFAAMLSRALESGEIKVIGTSDFASFRKTFDKDPSLSRRFQKIIIDAPTTQESLDILYGIRNEYEEYHNVKYTDEAIEACVKLADRYITERNLPDSAIDILDEVGALVGLVNEPKRLKQLRIELSKESRSLEIAKQEKEFEKIDKLGQKVDSLLDEYRFEFANYKEKKDNARPLITVDDILGIVSKKTKIPINNLTSDDKEKLSHMNDRLKENIIGQNEAIDTVCKALKRNRIGLRKNGCMYSALACGRTGVGKTLLAKKLAKELFGDENALVRFDMSEFSDKVAVNKLIGSNPGYVGYEEGGQLTEAIKNKKHCVLLLDEIEKADPEIYNVFLQVLDEGFLTDNSGQRVDFKNVIVIFTSNIGAKAAADFGKGIGFTENEDENTKRILTKQMKSKFPPEFLNRIDDIIYFNSLTDENLKDIIKIEIKKFENNLNEIGYECNYDNDVVDYIFNIVKDEKEYGARPIIRAIQDNIENMVTDAIIDGSYDSGYRFNIFFNSESECLAVS